MTEYEVQKFKETYRVPLAGFPNPEFGIQKINEQLRNAGYEMGVQGSNLICYNPPSGECGRPIVADFKLVGDVHIGKELLITAIVERPEGKNLADLIKNLELK